MVMTFLLLLRTNFLFSLRFYGRTQFKERYHSGPGGIRTHDLSNANAVSYRTRRPALDAIEQFYLVINNFNAKKQDYNHLISLNYGREWPWSSQLER